MNLVAHSIGSKGGLAFGRRVGQILWRFQLSSAKAERNLGAYISTMREFGCNATFPITAVILKRHQDLIRCLYDEGVEFAVHGYVHVDHTTLPIERQREHIARALDVFHAAGIPPDGFRCPYLRYNEDTVTAVQNLGFKYISNATVSYDVLSRDEASSSRWIGYQKALDLYSAVPTEQAVVRPYVRGNLVEIPVAMPDDEILVDRLGFGEGKHIGDVWSTILDQSHAHGDLLTLQLHPERGRLCRAGLSVLLDAAQAKSPRIWLAQLRDIASWWLRRTSYSIEVSATDDGRWRILGPEDQEAVVLLKNIDLPGATPWYGHYVAMNRTATVVESEVRPIIGVSAESTDLFNFLKEEGFATYRGISPDDCALYFDRPGATSLAEQAAILKQIESSMVPLVRIARWPNGARSALALTGDIDALTVRDFVSRIWEVM